MNIEALLRPYGDITINDPMKHHTTFRIGGNVSYGFYPKTIQGIQVAIEVAKKAGLPFKVVGKGSNLLWCDEDLDMIAIFPDRYCHEYAFQDQVLTCEAGCSLIALAFHAMEQGLSGLEFASGIPGTIGGAVFMNAGAYKSSMSDIVEAVQMIRNGELVWLTNEEMKFGYRNSILKQQPDWIVVAVRLRLQPKDKEQIHEVIQSRKQRRIQSQPLDKPSAGSTFKNPVEMPAWQAIEQLQLRGHQIGGAQISTKHCNFVINNGQASASDVLALVSYVQQRVYEELHIRLVMEVEQYKCPTTKNPSSLPTR